MEGRNRVLLIATGAGVALAVVAGAVYIYSRVSSEDDDNEQAAREQTSKRHQKLLEKEPETNEDLVERLKAAKYILNDRVAASLLEVDRSNFVVEGEPYHDAESPIGYNATISAPHITAFMLDLLANVIPEQDARVLDVGSGSGYSTACLGAMVGDSGMVFGMDTVEELVEAAKENIARNNRYLHKRIRLMVGDGFKGFEAGGPYDAIHVGVASKEVPQELIDQLKPGGRMVIPVGPPKGLQKLVQVDVSQDGMSVKATALIEVRFLPILSKKRNMTGKRGRGLHTTPEGDNLFVNTQLHHAPDTNAEEIKLVRTIALHQNKGEEEDTEKEKENQNV